MKMKKNYIKPIAEVPPRSLRDELLAGSYDGSLTTYGEEEDFTW